MFPHSLVRKMFLKQVVLLVLYLCYASSYTRIFMRNCGRFGFTCVWENRSLKLYFECPTKTEDYFIFLNEFNAPSKITQLFIKNCKTLTIHPKCTTYARERKNIKYLEVSNVERLIISPTPKYQSNFPTEVVFKNIANIFTIPSKAFTQFDRKLNTIRCIIPSSDLFSVYFQNVSINTIQTNAFYMPRLFGNMTFNNVRIKYMQKSSLVIEHYSNDGIFLMYNSTVSFLPPSSFKIAGRKAIFHRNKFSVIPSIGITASVDTFHFLDNSAAWLLPNALSISSKKVLISNNHFMHLKSGSFRKIRSKLVPLVKNKILNIFEYRFESNRIELMDDGSLEPDLGGLKDVGGRITFSRNNFSCSCHNMGWLFSKIGHGDAKSTLDTIYAALFSEENMNICSSSCNLTLTAATKMMKDGTCEPNANVEELCKRRYTLSTHYIVNSPSKTQHTMSVPGRNYALPDTSATTQYLKTTKQTTSSLKFNPQPPNYTITPKLPTAVVSKSTADLQSKLHQFKTTEQTTPIVKFKLQPPSDTSTTELSTTNITESKPELQSKLHQLRTTEQTSSTVKFKSQQTSYTSTTKSSIFDIAKPTPELQSKLHQLETTKQNTPTIKFDPQPTSHTSTSTSRTIDIAKHTPELQSTLITTKQTTPTRKLNTQPPSYTSTAMLPTTASAKQSTLEANFTMTDKKPPTEKLNNPVSGNNSTIPPSTAVPTIGTSNYWHYQKGTKQSTKSNNIVIAETALWTPRTTKLTTIAATKKPAPQSDDIIAVVITDKINTHESPTKNVNLKISTLGPVNEGTKPFRESLEMWTKSPVTLPYARRDFEHLEAKEFKSSGHSYITSFSFLCFGVIFFVL